jgi:hypothetical protein
MSPLFFPFFNYIKHVPLIAVIQKDGGITPDIVVTTIGLSEEKESLLCEDQQSKAMQANLKVSGVQLLGFSAFMDPLDRARPRVFFYRRWLLNLNLIFGLITKHCRRTRRTTRRL